MLAEGFVPGGQAEGGGGTGEPEHGRGRDPAGRSPPTQGLAADVTAGW